MHFYRVLAILAVFLLSSIVSGVYSDYRTEFEALPGEPKPERVLCKERRAQVQNRQAPPLTAYLWHYLLHTRWMADPSTDTMVSKKQKAVYRVTRATYSGWISSMIGTLGVCTILFLPLSHVAWIILLVLAVFLLSEILSGIYSYYRTVFEKVGKDSNEQNTR